MFKLIGIARCMLYICLSFVLISAISFQPSSAFAWIGTVKKVEDGDSLIVKRAGKLKNEYIRLYGIDAPEIGQSYGIQALEKLRQCAPKGSKVSIDVFYKDMHGRSVAIVENKSINCNRFLLVQGYAWVYTSFCKKAFCKDWKQKARQAKNDRRGLWRKNNPMPPWKWRKSN